MSDGKSRIIKIETGDMSDLTQYTGGTWSCKAGITDRPLTLIPPAAGSTWTGMSVLGRRQRGRVVRPHGGDELTR